MTRDQVRAQVLVLRRAQGLQDTVPAGQLLADLAADMLAQEIDKEAAA